MSYSIGMRTIAREPDYYEQSIMNLVRAGVLASPLLASFQVSHGEGITPNENGCRALEIAAGVSADWVIFMEDDLNVCDDFLGSLDRWLTLHATPEVLFYPLGANYAKDIAMALVEGRSAIPYRTAAYYGSVAVVLRPAHALAFATWLRNAGHPRSIDRWLATWAESLGCTRVLTPAPCFIDHIGRVSSIATREGHFTGGYEMFDQRVWFPPGGETA